MKYLALFLLVSPIMASPMVPIGHGVELTGFSYMGCAIGQNVVELGTGEDMTIPQSIAVHSFCLGLDLIYRAGEMGQGQDKLIRTKFAWDASGVLLHALLSVHPWKKTVLNVGVHHKKALLKYIIPL